jgi:hypothetical protein
MPRKIKEDALKGSYADKLIDAAVDIRMSPEAVERSYMARQLVQCTLPHSDPGDVSVWARTNGHLSRWPSVLMSTSSRASRFTLTALYLGSFSFGSSQRPNRRRAGAYGSETAWTLSC